MFTGIVEEVGVVEELDRAGQTARVRISATRVVNGTAPGDSIAVDGVCLTATQVDSAGLWADIMRVTLDVAAAGMWRAGDRVNLERAVAVGGRMGGHLVQGHVDGVARVVSRQSTDEWDDIVLEVPPALARYIAAKGSITLAGISLTVVWVDGNRLGVSLIPTTLAETTAGGWRADQPVNVEVDIIAKYVERLLGLEDES